MKLKNKKTGEIATLTLSSNGEELLLMKDNEMVTREVKLLDLKEWEDYEEPKEYWFIDYDGGIVPFNRNKETATDKLMKAIGNYFETKEEAELAVRKLKAWKRLKDNGFRFQFWVSSYSGDSISFFIDWINANSKKEIENDLDLLFGGEE
ncbi:MAG: hypothetical protein J6S67_10510 [Methanobrevibacter sp.]|nr:hypothetical protein [Methanobrevibacter sp.]